MKKILSAVGLLLSLVLLLCGCVGGADEVSVDLISSAPAESVSVQDTSSRSEPAGSSHQTSSETVIQTPVDDTKDQPSSTPSKTNTQSQTAVSSENTTPTVSTAVSSEEDKYAYKKLSCREVDEWKRIALTYREGEKQFFNIPADWSLKKEGDKFIISRGGKQIGAMTKKDPGGKYDFCEKDTKDLAGQLIASSVYKSDSGYRRVISLVYWGKTDYNRTYIDVDYCELDRYDADSLCYSTVAYIKPDNSLSIPLAKPTNASKQNEIIVAGNSFVWTSEVAGIFEQMLKSQGLYSNIRTFTMGGSGASAIWNNPYFKTQLRESGTRVLFMCGLYSMDDRNALCDIRDYCKQIGVEFVFFPAHNENSSQISELLANEPMQCLNWRLEITSLIQSGVPPLAMYVQDAHKHSTPMAGYVGASMIWRTLYGEQAPLCDAAGLSVEDISNTLGTYVRDGKVPEPSGVQERYVF